MAVAAVLPICAVKEEILELIHRNQICVITGETGSGKSTQLPQFLYGAGYAERGLIGVTQPRRIGVASVSKRVSEELGVVLGEEVGFAIRFEDLTSQATRVKFMTDGVLLRECLVHKLLEPYSVIVLDEAHERSLQTDILFGIVKAIARVRRDLKIIITSATLDHEKFCAFFGNCPALHVPGRVYPVDISYSDRQEHNYVEACVAKCLEIHTRERMGHVLAFLPGQAEIERACKLLGEKVDALFEDGIDMPDIVILPVYGALPSGAQQKVFAPTAPDTRKVVFATNICETSLTVDGVRYVVDPGWVKQKLFNPLTGIESLNVVPISRGAAVQRAGRAGRTAPGKCFRLYPREWFENKLQESTVPEIQRTNLASTVLLLKSIGVADPLSFPLLDRPSTQSMVEALAQLYFLAAIDETGRITELGKEMSMFPLEPQLSRLLLLAVHLGCVEDVLTIAAMMSVENIWIRPSAAQTAGDDVDPVEAQERHQAEVREAERHRQSFASVFGDFVSLLCVYDMWAAAEFTKSWCDARYIHHRSMRLAKEIRGQLQEILLQHTHRSRKLHPHPSPDTGNGSSNNPLNPAGGKPHSHDSPAYNSNSSRSSRPSRSSRDDDRRGKSRSRSDRHRNSNSSRHRSRRSRSRSRSHSRGRSHSRSRSRRNRSRSRSPSRSRARSRSRSFSRSRRRYDRDRHSRRDRSPSNNSRRRRGRSSSRSPRRRRHDSDSDSGSDAEDQAKAAATRSLRRRHDSDSDDDSDEDGRKDHRDEGRTAQSISEAQDQPTQAPAEPVPDAGRVADSRSAGELLLQESPAALAAARADPMAAVNVCIALAFFPNTVLGRERPQSTRGGYGGSRGGDSSKPTSAAPAFTYRPVRPVSLADAAPGGSGASRMILGNRHDAPVELYLHPSSVLFRLEPRPPCLVYRELVWTTKPFLRGCGVVDYEWVQPLLGRLKSVNVKRLTTVHSADSDLFRFDTIHSSAALAVGQVAPAGEGGQATAGDSAAVSRGSSNSSNSASSGSAQAAENERKLRREEAIQAAKARYLARKGNA